MARALEAIADRAPRQPENGMYDPAAVRYADALVELAEARLAATDPAPPTLVVHVDAEALAAGDGCGEVQGGPVLAGPAVRRLACDARLETVAERPDGSTVGIGRAGRTVPPWLARQVRRRDRAAGSPGASGPAGCTSTTWSTGPTVGRTNLDNLVTLCGHHHRLVHEGRLDAGRPSRPAPHLPPPRRPRLPSRPRRRCGPRCGPAWWIRCCPPVPIRRAEAAVAFGFACRPRSPSSSNAGGTTRPSPAAWWCPPACAPGSPPPWPPGARCWRWCRGSGTPRNWPTTPPCSWRPGTSPPGRPCRSSTSRPASRPWGPGPWPATAWRRAGRAWWWPRCGPSPSG